MNLLPRPRGSAPFYTTHTDRTLVRPPTCNARLARERDQTRVEKNLRTRPGVDCLRMGAAFANGARRARVARFYGRKVWQCGCGNGSCHGEARGSLPVLSPLRNVR